MRTPGARSITLLRDGAAVAHLSLSGSPVALTAQTPGRYTITETGSDISRHAAVTVNAGLPTASAAEAVDLRAVRSRGADRASGLVELVSTGRAGGARPRMAVLALDPAAAGQLIVMHFVHWAVLLALVPLAALGAALIWRGARPRTGRERAAWALTGIALVVGLLALAEPRVGPGPRADAVFAVDGSASIDSHQAAEQRSILARVGQTDCRAPCRIMRQN